MKQDYTDLIFSSLVNILYNLKPAQFTEVVEGTLLEGTQQKIDNLTAAMLFSYEQYPNLDIVAKIGNNIRRIKLKYGLPENILYQIEQINKTIVEHERLKSQQPYVFVLLPFKKDFFAVYETAIAPEFKELGCRIAHADDDRRGEKIRQPVIDFVLKQIQDADFLVADTTGHNPNVFYELGYAHANNKTVFIITQDDEINPPFNVRHWLHFFYKKDALNKLRVEISNHALPLIEQFKRVRGIYQ